jgi:hypothetical protein
MWSNKTAARRTGLGVRQMTIRAIVLLVAVLAKAQTALPPEVLDLSRIKAKMRENLDRMPHYTCLETIERSHRAPAKTDFRLVDTLRIEVTRIGQAEFYSWPGARRFEDDASDIVRSGTISTGEYSGHAATIFSNPATQIHYSGEETLKGHRALKYDYRVASFASGWTLRYAEQSGMVAAYGSFWADAETLELLRIELHADGIPANLPFKAVLSQIDYAKVRIGDADVVLPQSARLLLSRRDGESRNQVEFSQCRPYATKSAIRFDAEPEMESAQPPGIDELFLAPNISLSMELTQAIDSQSAAEGDVITARLSADAKLKNQVMVPKGALVRGRIRRLERYADPVPHFIVGLEFVEIDSGSKRWIFQCHLDQIDPVPGLSWVLSTKTAHTFEGGRGQATFYTFQGETLYTAEVPGAGTFFLQGTRFRLPEGLHMLWRTFSR